jgi:serine/threonine protein kinase
MMAKDSINTDNADKTDFTPYFGDAAEMHSNMLPIGTQMAEFTVTEVIGEGGFGIVYKAHDNSLDRTVAIKEYMPAAIASRGKGRSVNVKSERHAETFTAGLRSFVNEAKLLARFDHVALLKVYRFWEVNGTAYMVMPFYEGPTLKEALKALPNKPDEQWLLRLLMPLLEALELIHAQQCFHRDIAPDNILVMPGHKPLLLDFGAARRVIGDLTQMLTVFLKPGYAPIEQYADMPGLRQGAWTDIYALGAVIYHAITGAVPPPSIARMMRESMVPASEAAASRYSPALLNAVDRALCVRPEDRIQSATEFMQLLRLAPSTVVDEPEIDEPESVTEPVLEVVDVPKEVLVEPQIELKIEPPTQAISESTTTAVSESARGKSKAGFFFALMAAGLIAGAWWFMARQKPIPVVVPQTVVVAPEKKPDLPPPTQVILPKPPEVVVDAAFALRAIGASASADWQVAVNTDSDTLVIDRDRLNFTVNSSRAGYLYVFMLGTDEASLFQIFPNTVDKANRVAATKAVKLPRAGWSIEAAGPPGRNRLLVLVTEKPQTFSSLGLKPLAAGSQEFAPLDFKKIRDLVTSTTTNEVSTLWNCSQDTKASGQTMKCGTFGVAEFGVTEVKP